ncbi:Branched-chain-amino-acid aminotransferase [Symbiodinium microadriaticum]|uniref:Branched-chain-amino-acid aminotransferase n=1 Tax=Symbiodinium microadriaticum TaxID=2951 RepID=A0A1Q9DL87_SYMMI|nr:Branched-chain-amino-acid aminotransferase [Symbiodinium microadriaticum]
MAVGSANLEWKSLGFGVQPTNGYSCCVWKDGSWGELSLIKEPFLRLHVNSVALHYGQTVWEGMKAFHCKDGSVRVFNDVANHERLSRGAKRMLIPELSLEKFREAVDFCVRNNVPFLPPYGTGGALYLRPILLGTGPALGLAPAKEYAFLVICSPVMNYFASAGPEILEKGVAGKVVLNYDRSAARGMGSIKCSGNYGADLWPSAEHKAEGFMVGLYLDPTEQRYIEEFNVTNFATITKDGKYITPESPSILASVTNKCLQQLASDMGLQVEQRRMDFLQEVNTFSEVAAVGTAAVVLPIRSLTMREKTFHFEKHEVMAKLKTQLEAIQELGQLLGPQRSTFFEVMRRTRTDGQGSLFPVRLRRPGCESEELVPSAWPARLDTRFRELQRRGNEIAGDSSRPMKEIDASEYLRELETFHAEQERYVEQVREILKSNPSSGAPGAPGAGAGILGSARLEDLRGPGAIGAGTSMPMAGMPNAAPSGVGLGAGSGLRTGPASGTNPLGGGGGPMQSQPSLPSGLGGGFGKALPVNSLPSLGGVNSASGAAGIRPDMRLPKIEAPGLSSLEEMGSVKLNTAVLPDSGTSVCSGGASCGENQSRQS